MSTLLQGKRIAILATDGFEQDELTKPLRALAAAGADVDVVSPSRGAIRGWKHSHWAEEVPVDVELSGARPEDYDAVVLPGGVINSDRLRHQPEAVRFVRHFVEANKPIGAVCHGAWTLIEAGGVSGHTMTSWPSIRSDLVNAGARWVDEEVVVDDGLVTSRKPADLDAFDEKLIAELAKARPPATDRLHAW
ncbi:MAG TPA: type 1 glutamine amidotransferase domain-containing protein [Polyangiaceae bacterium]|nr:type 1 glutamine amidotransferase domain-containing protein [Polyangiaceae bacterium]